MLEIVEHNQRFLVWELFDESLGNPSASSLTDADGHADRRGNEVWIANTGEGNKKRPVREVCREAARCFGRETRLAYPAGTGQGHQANAGVPQHRCHRGDFALPPDERGRWHRKTGSLNLG